MTKLMEVVYAEKIKLDGMENLTNEEKLHDHEQLQHFFKYVDSCQDFFDNKFLVFYLQFRPTLDGYHCC